jgi:hypothetical protein
VCHGREGHPSRGYIDPKGQSQPERGDDDVTRPNLRITGVTIGAPDPGELAEFYARLLGWTDSEREKNWAQVNGPEVAGAVSTLNFEVEPDYVRPTWPSVAGRQQIMTHLDIAVDDLEGATRWAIEQGAVLADFQPQDDVRVMLDPAGHPFCLFVTG